MVEACIHGRSINVGCVKCDIDKAYEQGKRDALRALKVGQTIEGVGWVAPDELTNEMKEAATIASDNFYSSKSLEAGAWFNALQVMFNAMRDAAKNKSQND